MLGCAGPSDLEGETLATAPLVSASLPPSNERHGRGEARQCIQFPRVVIIVPPRNKCINVVVARTIRDSGRQRDGSSSVASPRRA